VQSVVVLLETFSGIERLMVAEGPLALAAKRLRRHCSGPSAGMVRARTHAATVRMPGRCDVRENPVQQKVRQIALETRSRSM
jgi:hypothetical protein